MELNASDIDVNVCFKNSEPWVEFVAINNNVVVVNKYFRRISTFRRILDEELEIHSGIGKTNYVVTDEQLELIWNKVRESLKSDIAFMSSIVDKM